MLNINLQTGRTHQIRVHFSHLGHPLVGDDLYGGETTILQRQALHCHELKFTHPMTKKLIHLQSNIYNDLKLFITHHENNRNIESVI